jgi:hypothetical protein
MWSAMIRSRAGADQGVLVMQSAQHRLDSDLQGRADVILHDKKGVARTWCLAPPTPKLRLGGAVLGFLGLFLLGVLGRLFLGHRPVGFDELAYWGVGGSFVGAVIGFRYPKVTTCIFFPLMLLGFFG